MSLQPDCVRYLRNAPEGLCLEFGVMGGRSTRLLAESGRTIYAFDSFRGLPHDWGWDDRRGIFAHPRPTDLPDNVVIHEGLFSDTLEVFLGGTDERIGFCHIDCDIYTSCAYVLNCLSKRWQAGSIIIFDDIRQDNLPGERRAWERHRKDWELIELEHSHGEIWRRSR
jgi:predicted O-methyltransferase YrrM